uniref:Piccolo presynaptic cytomatrix protein n=1 Tax=Sus scrofa TaxID=9823 RepID=A0A8D1E7B5_PIG
MSADEDASGSEDDEFIRNQLKELTSSLESQKKEEAKGKGKGAAGKHRRLTRKSSASFDDDPGRRHSWHDEDDETFDESPELKYRETKSQEGEELVVAGGGGLRRFKTIELSSTIADKYSAESSQKKTALYFDEEPELEMESLTDSPEDRSRGEGSSSLHASSFTPGTSPTSVSSLDEDSDSSPSHRKGESKQQRKARHRSHGPLLPTIEDSSEEEELREEEELLKEQEKQRELEQQQRKSSSKKSKKDKDELRAQRRRERPKTPPSNLSPIEDASPTEELRQAAEMEELHRSSCSEYSPSIESDPEGFEISPEKIIEVQKVYKLPTAVSLYSPTDEQSIMQKEGGQKALKSAEEMYEEMMHKPQKYKAFPAANERDELFEKEPLYGGMLIEDYIYESLVEDTYNGSVDGSLLIRQEEENGFLQQRGREQKIRLPEQIYEDPMQKITDLQKEFYELESLHSVLPQEDIVSSSFIIPESHEIVDLGSMVTSTSEEKKLLDADAAYEELMKRQQMQLTPGSSPTQPPIRDDVAESTMDFDRVPDASLTSSVLSGASLTDSTSSTTLSIPDVKITQHFSAEEIEDEYVTDYAREIQEIIAHESLILTYSEPSESATSVPPSDTPSLTSSVSSVCTTDSSSPVTTLDGITTVYTEPVDIGTKFEDSEEISSSTYFPGSVIDYPEEAKGSQTMTPSGTQKKVKRTLPNPPPEEVSTGTQSTYSTVGTVSRRRICRTNTMARAKILQDIDRELDLVERESAKLRKKQAELDEEEKEIDAKLRYLEMGINRRKEALLKEREKRERAYLQGVAEDRDYMSDSEVSSARPTRIESQHGIERPRTAPQPEFSQFIPPQTQTESQLVPPTSPYTQYQYSSPALPTQAPTPYTQQSHFQQQTLYHQQVSPYQTQPTFQAVATMSFTPQAQPTPTPQPSYQLPSQMMVIQQKPRQTALYLEPKITSNYEVIRNQPLMIAPVSTDNTYAVSHLGSKYNSLDLRIGLEERSSMASSPISSISADSFYADIDHHTSRNYVLIDDIGEITKGTGALSTAFSLHEKDLSKTDRLLRTTETRRSQEVTDFLAPLQTSSRLHSYVKAEEDPMEDPYELKLLKQQIKQEFRRGAESLDHLAGLSHYYHADTGYRHFPKSEKYSISRLTLEKQAAKQLPAAILYQKQSKHKKSLIDPKMSKFSPIQESRDLEPDYSSYMTSSTSSIGGISSRARLLQDDITFGLRKNITDQQKFMGSSLGTGLGTLGNTIRSALQDEADKPYSSGSRSRPSSRPSSVYGLDLSLKRDSSSSSLRLKAQEAEALDVSFSHASPSGRTKPTSLPISQSRGRIPIVAQNSEEESPLSPVGQPMGMARAAAGPLPPISADTRDQFGSSHSLPEVQQHMREESRTRGYDRDIAFIMDDFQHAMSDSEGKLGLRLPCYSPKSNSYFSACLISLLRRRILLFLVRLLHVSFNFISYKWKLYLMYVACSSLFLFSLFFYCCFLIVCLICLVSTFPKPLSNNCVNKIWSSFKSIIGKFFIVCFFYFLKCIFQVISQFLSVYEMSKG